MEHKFKKGTIKISRQTHPWIKDLKILKNLPDSLLELDLSDCINLKEITSLPTGLLKFKCIHCYALKNLPEFPKSLIDLKLHDIDIIALPQLHEGLLKLTVSSCDDLKELPFLPESLLELDCSDNFFTEIFLSPNLQKLNCSVCTHLERIHTSSFSLKNINCYDCEELEYLPTVSPECEEIKCSLVTFLKTLNFFGYLLDEVKDCAYVEIQMESKGFINRIENPDDLVDSRSKYVQVFETYSSLYKKLQKCKEKRMLYTRENTKNMPSEISSLISAYDVNTGFREESFKFSPKKRKNSGKKKIKKSR